MQTIAAWVYDPTKSLFGDKNGSAASYTIACQNPQGCDLYTRENTCILAGAMKGCKFGRKNCVNGPTKRARSFHSWMEARRKENAEWIGKLDSNKAWNRIVKIQDYYYLPYAHMDAAISGKTNFFGSDLWIPSGEMTTDFLHRICVARPMALFGGEITDYQKKVVPKFLTDLRMFYPALFDLLPEDQKALAATVSAVGRLADITTCLPGRYKFGTAFWDWDGSNLIGRSMLFQPVKGDIKISIKPERGQGVTITADAQVGSNTIFLD